MTEEDEEFNRIEREASLRMEAVTVAVAKKREWVGLTDEEIDDLSREMVKDSKSVNWLSRAIEQRLKEKNCGGV
jgi:hypothetical protein